MSQTFNNSNSLSLYHNQFLNYLKFFDSTYRYDFSFTNLSPIQKQNQELPSASTTGWHRLLIETMLISNDLLGKPKPDVHKISLQLHKVTPQGFTKPILVNIQSNLELGYLEFCVSWSIYLNQKYILIAFSNHKLALGTFLHVQITRSANYFFEISRFDYSN